MKNDTHTLALTQTHTVIKKMVFEKDRERVTKLKEKKDYFEVFNFEEKSSTRPPSDATPLFSIPPVSPIRLRPVE